jgi:hypothetical protein
VSSHPILALVQDHDVKQAKGFRAAAERITGASLEADYQSEVAATPKRSEQGLAHLGVRTGRRAKARQHGRDERHLAEAIARAAAAGNLTAPNRVLELPSGEAVTIVDHNVPIRTAAPEAEKGDADPNAGIEDIPLLAVLGEDRPAIVVLKFIDVDSNRSGANDTPLRLMLQGFAHPSIEAVNCRARPRAPAAGAWRAGHGQDAAGRGRRRSARARAGALAREEHHARAGRPLRLRHRAAPVRLALRRQGRQRHPHYIKLGPSAARSTRPSAWCCSSTRSTRRTSSSRTTCCTSSTDALLHQRDGPTRWSRRSARS